MHNGAANPVPNNPQDFQRSAMRPPYQQEIFSGPTQAAIPPGGRDRRIHPQAAYPPAPPAAQSYAHPAFHPIIEAHLGMMYPFNAPNAPSMHPNANIPSLQQMPASNHSPSLELAISHAHQGGRDATLLHADYMSRLFPSIGRPHGLRIGDYFEPYTVIEMKTSIGGATYKTCLTLDGNARRNISSEWSINPYLDGSAPASASTAGRARGRNSDSYGPPPGRGHSHGPSSHGPSSHGPSGPIHSGESGESIHRSPASHQAGSQALNTTTNTTIPAASHATDDHAQSTITPNTSHLSRARGSQSTQSILHAKRRISNIPVRRTTSLQWTTSDVGGHMPTASPLAMQSDISAYDSYTPCKTSKRRKGRCLELTVDEKENVDVFSPTVASPIPCNGKSISKTNALQLHEEEWLI